jgi:hypothetical protein
VTYFSTVYKHTKFLLQKLQCIIQFHRPTYSMMIDRLADHLAGRKEYVPVAFAPRNRRETGAIKRRGCSVIDGPAARDVAAPRCLAGSFAAGSSPTVLRTFRLKRPSIPAGFRCERPRRGSGKPVLTVVRPWYKYNPVEIGAVQYAFTFLGLQRCGVGLVAVPSDRFRHLVSA